MTTLPVSTTAVGRILDEAPAGRFHRKAALIAGMGFFTDSYDLNVISTALLLLKPEWHLSAGQVGLIGSTALIASFLGALLFGRLGDLVGRKRIYGLEAAIMAVGAVLTACSPGFLWLLVARFALGVGVGGDYPISATIMTEYANRWRRGRQVAIMFSSYTLGQVAAFAVALVLLLSGMDHDLAWRLMLGLGAVPALAVLYSRRRLPESPRYTAAVRGDDKAAVDAVRQVDPDLVAEPPATVDVSPTGRGAMGLRRLLTDRRLLVVLLGTAGVWFLFDVAIYGNSISQPLIVSQLLGGAGTANPATVTAVNLGLAVAFSVTGVVVGIALMDRIPRRTQQMVGLGLCGLPLILIGVVPGLTAAVVPFVLCFGLSSFGATVGPNPTTMVLAAESFPTSVRATGHGVSAAVGKLGAYLGALLLPLALAVYGLRTTEISAGLVFLLGIPLTRVLPEPMGRPLDDVLVEPQLHPVSSEPASTPR